ncbi:MAG: hypothetical protein IAG13_24145, partial [Deltaproteobacteria bacterium]|nr:hypothetical protein [Nannocystaceae bacterium]
MSQPSPVAAMFSWIAMAGIAVVVAFVGFAWPDDDGWADALWTRLPAAAPTKKAAAVAAAGEPGDSD